MSREEFLRKLGERIRTLRELKGKTQKDIYELADIGLTHISDIELGKVCARVCTLKRIAEVLEVEVRDFFDWD